MKRALPMLLLLLAFTVDAKKPPVKPPPPPPPTEELEEEDPLPPEEELTDEERKKFEEDVDEILKEQEKDDEAPAPRTKKRTGKSKNGDPELSDEEAGMIALGSMCCCLIFVIGLVVLIVWLVKRSSGTAKPVQSNFPPQSYAPPAQAEVLGGMQLSILALAIEPQAREVVEQQLSQLGISPVPTTTETRARLVSEAARALLTVQPSWRQFGYGEKPGLADLAAAESSYRTASEDFRQRAVSVGATATAGSGLVVVTLLVCSRRALMGASRLDDPNEVRRVLEDRMRVSTTELLGAELLWAPAAAGGRITEAEIGLRFPEMLPLPRTAI
jgi:uncharacterized membrane protein